MLVLVEKVLRSRTSGSAVGAFFLKRLVSFGLHWSGVVFSFLVRRGFLGRIGLEVVEVEVEKSEEEDWVGTGSLEGVGGILGGGGG